MQHKHAAAVKEREEDEWGWGKEVRTHGNHNIPFILAN